MFLESWQYFQWLFVYVEYSMIESCIFKKSLKMERFFWNFQTTKKKYSHVPENPNSDLKPDCVSEHEIVFLLARREGPIWRAYLLSLVSCVSPYAKVIKGSGERERESKIRIKMPQRKDRKVSWTSRGIPRKVLHWLLFQRSLGIIFFKGVDRRALKWSCTDVATDDASCLIESSLSTVKLRQRDKRKELFPLSDLQYA